MAEKRLEDMLWKNIMRIKSESDERFARSVLEARRDFLRLRMRQEPAIRKVYIDAADRVAEELRKLKPSIGQLTRNHLAALEKSLRQEAERISRAVEDRLKTDLAEAVRLGASPLQRQLLQALKGADVPLDFLNLQRGFGDVNTRAVEAIWARTRNGLRLSDRIWRIGESARNTMRDIILDGVARGRDAVKVARDLEKYVAQGAGSIARDYPDMMRRMGKRVPQTLSYEALRLARTEMSMAFMEGTYAAGRVNPSYKGVRWMLSASHPMEDVCDELAEANLYGLGPGGYPMGEEPPLAHPNCLCYVVPLVADTEELVERLKRWRDNPALEPGVEQWYNDFYRGLHPNSIVVNSAEEPAAAPKWKPGAFPKNGFPSVEDATAWARATYPSITWDFEGAVTETVNPSLRQFHKLAKRYPIVLDRLRYVGTYQGPQAPYRYTFPPGVYAHATTDGSIMGLNPAWFGDEAEFKKSLVSGVKSGFHPYGCDTVESVITHEFGHLLRNNLRLSNKAFTEYALADGFGLVDATVILWEDYNGAKMANTSEYATTNINEAWAETFAAMYHSSGKYAVTKRMKALLTVVADPKKWHDSPKWLKDLPDEEREAAIEDVVKLRKRIGLKAKWW